MDGVAEARGLGSPIGSTGSLWGDLAVTALVVWLCLRWASGIDDVKTVKSKQKRKWWRRILFPLD
jgi:hypothetical protein